MSATRSYWRGREVMYRCYDGDRLIYVGKSSDVAGRLANHALESWWWQLVTRVKVSVFRTHIDALTAERTAIRGELPVFNLRSSGRTRDDRSHWRRRDRSMERQWNADRDYVRRRRALAVLSVVAA